ncbi:hypothetical protein [Bradyrhizobium sp. DOA1]|uniref:pPIWI-associating nuclease domain-containing protein n=1 Tax=Bradyrhizobium sp. DOA1 TaxID=1126616 RepID=UPI00077C1AEC|nr:hypothetical protein [Bradyrhizobium sp. DOA1]KYG97886.1 hypothetical protein SE91_04430 [Bradyrhizobium sp. DOA1]
MRNARPLLSNAAIDDETIGRLDVAFQELLRLASSRNVTDAYQKRLRIIRRLAPTISAALELKAGEHRSHEALTSSDKQIIQTLERTVPSAALSYRQALADLSDAGRVSFRGSGTELREALREVLDHLAPDREVMAMDGFKLEKDRQKPTMRQKVMHILKARGRSKTAMGSPSEAVEMVEGLTGNLARSVYNHGSLSTHVHSTHQDVARLKRYVDVVLLDILEL